MLIRDGLVLSCRLDFLSSWREIQISLGGKSDDTTMFGKKQDSATPDNSQPVPRCSFCDKAQNDVRKLIFGPSVCICDDCVSVCEDIIADDARFSKPGDVSDGGPVISMPEVPVSGAAVRVSGAAVRCALCYIPTPVSDGLLIPNRGVLCPGCIGEVEAAVAERRESETDS
jgi:hypothetical protein